MSDITLVTIDFVKSNSEWAAPIAALLAFCESFAFISVLVPATLILFGFGALIGASGLEFWPIWLATVLGATAGDWLAYDLALRFAEKIVNTWPLSRNPVLLARGMAFFKRWGVLSVFVGRFFGPLRAVVPIAAGLCRMPWGQFQLGNVASALVWATGILTPGAVGMRWLIG